jgi:hypothetical protein
MQQKLQIQPAKWRRMLTAVYLSCGKSVLQFDPPPLSLVSSSARLQYDRQLYNHLKLHSAKEAIPLTGNDIFTYTDILVMKKKPSQK